MIMCSFTCMLTCIAHQKVEDTLARNTPTHIGPVVSILCLVVCTGQTGVGCGPPALEA